MISPPSQESHLDAAKTRNACVSGESLMVVLVMVVVVWGEGGQLVQQRVERIHSEVWG